jgi:hypothetical protein
MSGGKRIFQILHAGKSYRLYYCHSSRAIEDIRICGLSDVLTGHSLQINCLVQTCRYYFLKNANSPVVSVGFLNNDF